MHKETKFILKMTMIAITVVLGLTCFFTSCTTVDSGNVGVVKHYGAVQPEILSEGIHFIRPFGMASIYEMNAKMQPAKAKAEASSMDMQNVSTVVEVQFSIAGSMAPKVLRNIGDTKSVGVTVLGPAIQESVKAVTAKYTAVELITKRGEVKGQIEIYLNEFVTKTLSNKNLSGAIDVANMAITDFDFSAEFNSAIEAKVKAEQDALKAKNEKTKRVTNAEASAAEKKLSAEADAFKIEAVSKARAEAIKREAEALKSHPELIKLRQVEKWNGQLPTYNGGGALPMLHLK